MHNDQRAWRLRDSLSQLLQLWLISSNYLLRQSYKQRQLMLHFIQSNWKNNWTVKDETMKDTADVRY